MIPWIQIYSNLPRHPKVSALADELKLNCAAVNPNAVAVGMLVNLWTWAIQNAYDGDLSKCSARAIADACTWRRKPEELLKALISAGFIDEDMRLHDWEEYTLLFLDKAEEERSKTAERVKRYRERQRNA